MSTPTVIQSAAALYGIVPSASFVASINDEIATVFGGSEEALLNHYFELVFVVNNGNTSQEVASRMVANMGLTGDEATTETARIAGLLEAAPVNERGALVKTVVTEFEASGSVAATSFVSKKDALLTAVNDSSYQGIAGQEVVFANLSVAQIQSGTTASIFALTSGDDELTGTAGDDVFNAVSAAVSTLDELDGGSGADTLNIVANGNVAALDVSNIETVNFVVRAFADTTLDAANIDGATINVKNAGSGFSSAATVDNVGDNKLVVGTGISSVTVGANDEGIVNVGSASTVNLEVSAAGNELLFEVTDISNAAVSDSTSTSTASSIVVSGGLGTLSVTPMAAAGSLSLTDVSLSDGAYLKVDTAQINTTGFEATGNGVLGIEIGNATDATIDVEDSDPGVTFRINDASTHTLSFDNADGKTFILGAAQVTNPAIDIDTSDEIGAGFDVGVLVADTKLLIGANADYANVTLLSSSASRFLDLTIDGDVTLDAGSVNFGADATSELNETDTSARFFVKGSGAITLTDLDLTYVDASAVSGQMTIDVAKGSGSQRVIAGSGNDLISVDAASSAAVDLSGGAGNDRFDLTAKVTGDSAFDGGAGDDLFVLGTSAAAFADGDSNVIIGGSGTDTISFNVSAGAIDGSAAATKIFIAEVEVISVSAAATNTGLTLAADQLSGDVLTLKGSATSANEYVTIATDANDLSIDLSTVTVADTIESLTIDAATALVTALPVTITTTDFGETVNLEVTNTKGTILNTGGGNDTIELAAGTLAGKVTINAGSGINTIDLSTNAVVSTRAKPIVINDYQVGVDTIAIGVAIEGNTAAPVDVKTKVTGATELTASVVGGKVTIAGASAYLVDTVDEWIEVVELGAGTTAVAAFEFGGDTYIVETGAADAHTNVIQLVGITGASLGPAGAANILIG
jgi:hypothetical protein